MVSLETEDSERAEEMHKVRLGYARKEGEIL